MFTIDMESKQSAKQSIDIDNMRDRYKTSNGLCTFPSPSLETIDKNLFFLLKNSMEKTFDSKYSMRPEYLSEDEYGTTALWQLLMYINNIFCKEDFELSTVIIPSLQSIITMCQDNYPKKDIIYFEGVQW